MKSHEEYEKLINGLGVDNFNFLIKEYVKEYYNTKELHISDGPYDGGMDLTYFKDEEEIKKNIQITVTKTKIKEKILEDVKKAKKNSAEFAYQSKLDFYISSTLSNVKKRDYVYNADVTYNIDLKIIDAKKLAGNMDEFPSIKNTLQKIFDFKEEESTFKLSKQSKLLFNVIASGEDSSKIKRHLIHAYILTYIFETPGLNLDEVFRELKKAITVVLNQEDIFQEINYLKSKGYLEGSTRFHLSNKYNETLQSLLDLNNIQEKDLSVKINKLLSENNINIKSELISKKLIQLYIQHFKFDIEELSTSSSSFSKPIKKIFHDISILLNKAGLKDIDECDNIAKKIFDVSSSNSFLTNIGASSMYVNLFNSNKLESFITSSYRSVCVDTQVLLRLLCVLHKPITTDKSMSVVYRFHQTVKENQLNLNLYTAKDYVEEVAAHLQKALKIYNYIKLPLFEKIGSSRNVFYNYYKELEIKGKTKGYDFKEFIQKEILGFNIPNELSANFIKEVLKRLIKLFEYLGYEVVTPDFYENFDEIKRKFETELSFKSIVRSGKAIKHDIRTAIYLSDAQNHFDFEDETYLDPYIITWDYQFYKLREVLDNNSVNYNHWFVYTPQKFIEKIQLEKFKIKPESINETILSIVESDYNNTSNKRTFIDVISSIFNVEEVGELKLAQKFADIEGNYISEVESKENFKDVIGEESPLTQILSILIAHFNEFESKTSMEDFSKLCENDSKANQLIDIINMAILELKQSKLDKGKLFDNIKSLIEK